MPEILRRNAPSAKDTLARLALSVEVVMDSMLVVILLLTESHIVCIALVTTVTPKSRITLVIYVHVLPKIIVHCTGCV